jgi:ribonuclease HI
MTDVMLFTDGSADTKTRIGFGAYLAVEDLDAPYADLNTKVKVRRFENTSSTPLELQTLLWALDDALLPSTESSKTILIYSDSQNILSLLERREGLEQRDFFAGNGRRLKNAELYQAFFTAMDQHSYEIIKIKGHKPQHSKDNIDRIFSLVDKASRSALREFNRQASIPT